MNNIEVTCFDLDPERYLHAQFAQQSARCELCHGHV